MIQANNKAIVHEFLKDYFEEKFSKQVIEKFVSAAEKITNFEALTEDDVETLVAIDERFMKDQGIHLFTPIGLQKITSNLCNAL